MRKTSAVRLVGTVGLVGLVGLVTPVAAVGPLTTPTSATLPTQPTARTAQTDLTGKWRMSLDMEMGRATPLLDLKQNESKLSGTYTGRYGSSPLSGDVDGRSVTFAVAMETTTLHFRGEFKEDGTLAGTADFGEMGAVKWTAAREQ